MAKINKRQYSKLEWHSIRAQRRQEKITKRQTESTEVDLQIDTTKTIFVVGNGTSRKPIDLNLLKKYGKVYGCNALYREFDPDVLVAVDTKMVLELNKAKYQHRVPVWTNPNKSYSGMTGFNFFNPSKGWSSGPTALWKASEDSAEEIYILGFDYKGLGDNYDKVNNVYAGTHNYKKEHERATFYGNWLKQTAITIQKNPQTRYIRVIEDRGFVPKELTNLSNLTHMSIEDFKNFFK